jgi:hypothetical protein
MLFLFLEIYPAKEWEFSCKTVRNFSAIFYVFRRNDYLLQPSRLIQRAFKPKDEKIKGE